MVMLQSMGSQRVGHDLATEQQKNSMCLLWAPQMLRQDLGEMRWLWTALGQHYQEVNRTGKGRRQKGEAPSKLCRWELWCNPSLCTTPPKLEFSDEQKGNWSLTIPVPNPLGGHEQNLVCTRTQGKGAVPPTKDWPRPVHECPGVSGRAVGQWGPLQGRGTECSSAWDLWRRSPLSSLPPPQFGLRSNYKKWTQPGPSAESWITDLLSMAPLIETTPSYPLSQSLPSGSFHKPLILLHQRVDWLKTTISEN